MLDLKPIARRLFAIGGQTVTIDSNGFTSRDGTLYIKENITTGLEKPITVSTKLFTSLVSKCSFSVSLTLQEGGVVLESAKFKAKLPLIQEAAPLSLPSSLSGLVKIDAKTILDLMNFCGSVTADNEEFDYTSGVRILGGQSLEATATDKLRIAVASIVYTGKPFDLFIPSKVIRVLKLLEEKEIGLGQTDSTIVIESGNITLVAKKLTKQLPDIWKVFPKSYALETTIKIKDLQDSLNRVSPTVDPENQKVFLTFDGNRLIISATGEGEATDEIEIETSDPFSFIKIAASMKFLQSGLTSFGKDGILNFKLNDGGKPFLWEVPNKKLLLAGMKL